MNEKMKYELDELSDRIDSQPTFFMWMINNLTINDLMVLREHGPESSILGAASVEILTGIFDQFIDIEDVALSKEFWSLPRVKNAVGTDQVKVALVWTVAEHYARDYNFLHAFEAINKTESGDASWFPTNERLNPLT